MRLTRHLGTWFDVLLNFLDNWWLEIRDSGLPDHWARLRPWLGDPEDIFVDLQVSIVLLRKTLMIQDSSRMSAEELMLNISDFFNDQFKELWVIGLEEHAPNCNGIFFGRLNIREVNPASGQWVRWRWNKLELLTELFVNGCEPWGRHLDLM